MVESYSKNTDKKLRHRQMVDTSYFTGVCFYGDTADRVLNLMAADGNRKPDFKPKDCKYLNRKHAQSGIYKIYPDENEPQSVYCDMETDGGGWTVVVRRVDGSENFYRNWHTYERGFGNLKREFWIGDSFSKHNGFAFSTPDSDNDTWPKGNCAATSGWWYYACDDVSLTKSYNKKSSPIEWEQWKGSGVSIKYAVMMTRPK
ncbi:unnamed protein product [Mytilus edulis]|uniref:Fibrinogen C-terminal domain-containing protein n=1 Tax=Mytilus edulis TaxID=6550 RepID=A0A8S3V9T4_MYTED|nr:unnamed protein product [Mytilus edulis]